MDSREDEQLRGITMKTSSISLHHQNDQNEGGFSIKTIIFHSILSLLRTDLKIYNRVLFTGHAIRADSIDL